MGLSQPRPGEEDKRSPGRRRCTPLAHRAVSVSGTRPRGQSVHNSARGETQRKTSRVESGSIVMNSGFHLNLAAKLSSVWGPLLSSQPSWSQ